MSFSDDEKDLIRDAAGITRHFEEVMDKLKPMLLGHMPDAHDFTRNSQVIQALIIEGMCDQDEKDILNDPALQKYVKKSLLSPDLQHRKTIKDKLIAKVNRVSRKYIK